MTQPATKPNLAEEAKRVALQQAPMIAAAGLGAGAGFRALQELYRITEERRRRRLPVDVVNVTIPTSDEPDPFRKRRRPLWPVLVREKSAEDGKSPSPMKPDPRADPYSGWLWGIPLHTAVGVGSLAAGFKGADFLLDRYRTAAKKRELERERRRHRDLLAAAFRANQEAPVKRASLQGPPPRPARTVGDDLQRWYRRVWLNRFPRIPVQIPGGPYRVFGANPTVSAPSAPVRKAAQESAESRTSAALRRVYEDLLVCNRILSRNPELRKEAWTWTGAGGAALTAAGFLGALSAMKGYSDGKKRTSRELLREVIEQRERERIRKYPPAVVAVTEKSRMDLNDDDDFDLYGDL
jgi:hypothetical protein